MNFDPAMEDGKLVFKRTVSMKEYKTIEKIRDIEAEKKLKNAEHQ